MKAIGLLLVLASSMAPEVALAQASDADRATARALAGQGYEAQKRGDYAIAADDFERADTLVHAPTLQLGLARAQVGLGKLVEAQETYRRIIREGLDASAPAPFAKAVEDAKREVTALGPRLAWVTIDVRGPSAPSVVMDSTAVPPAALGVKRACNPGQHTLKASAEGFAPAERTFAVDDGGDQAVSLSLKALPTSPALEQATIETAPSPRDSPREQGARPSGELPPTPLATKVGIAALGVGAAGLLAGGVTGALVLSKHASLSHVCPNGHCSPSESHDVAAYHTLATVSTASTVVGACAAVTGIALLIATPKTAPVTVYAGLLHVGVAGAF
jgi:hypothetical protein